MSDKSPLQCHVSQINVWTHLWRGVVVYPALWHQVMTRFKSLLHCFHWTIDILACYTGACHTCDFDTFRHLVTVVSWDSSWCIECSLITVVWCTWVWGPTQSTCIVSWSGHEWWHGVKQYIILMSFILIFTVFVCTLTLCVPTLFTHQHTSHIQVILPYAYIRGSLTSLGTSS